MRKIEWPLLGENDIEVRIATCKEGKTALLLYQNSRTAMDALDATVGQMNWQITYKSIGDKVYGELSIWDDEKNQWIAKSDTGEESNISADKGQSSDILKRCVVRFGFARELYTSPRIVIDNSNKFAKYFVRHIAYNDKREISELTIVDAAGNVVFNWTKYAKKQQPATTTTTNTNEMIPKKLYAQIVNSQSLEELKTLWDSNIDLHNNTNFKRIVGEQKKKLAA